MRGMTRRGRGKGKPVGDRTVLAPVTRSKTTGRPNRGSMGSSPLPRRLLKQPSAPPPSTSCEKSKGMRKLFSHSSVDNKRTVRSMTLANSAGNSPARPSSSQIGWVRASCPTTQYSSDV